MAKLNCGEVECVAGKDEDYDYAAYQKDGRTAETFESGDVVQVRIADTEGGTPILSFDSSTPTANGSSVSKTLIPASGVVSLHRSDTSAWSGRKYLEMNLVDAGDGNRIKQFIRCELVVKQSQ
jgi:hypothetical protein